MGKYEDIKFVGLTLKDISTNRKIGWFLSGDLRTVKQTMDIATGTTRLVGYLSDKEAERVRKDFGLQANTTLPSELAHTKLPQSGKEKK